MKKKVMLALGILLSLGIASYFVICYRLDLKDQEFTDKMRKLGVITTLKELEALHPADEVNAAVSYIPILDQFKASTRATLAENITAEEKFAVNSKAAMEVITRIEGVASKPECNFLPRPYRQPYSSISLDNYSQMRTLLRTYSRLSTIDFEKGNISGGFRKLRVARQLCDHLYQDPTNVAGIVGLSGDGIIIINAVFAGLKLKEVKDVESLIAILERSLKLKSRSEYLNTNYPWYVDDFSTSYRQLIENMHSQEGDFHAPPMSKFEQAIASHPISARLVKLRVQQDIYEVATILNQAKTFRERQSAKSKMSQSTGYIGGLSLYLSYQGDFGSRSPAYKSMAIARLKMHAEFLRTGVLPKTPPSQYRDEYSGGPIQVKVLDGEPILYSIGPNLTNDAAVGTSLRVFSGDIPLWPSEAFRDKINKRP